MTPVEGVSTRLTETVLTRRACELLGNGPADAVALIEHVCQLPGAFQSNVTLGFKKLR